MIEDEFEKRAQAAGEAYAEAFTPDDEKANHICQAIFYDGARWLWEALMEGDESEDCE